MFELEMPESLGGEIRGDAVSMVEGDVHSTNQTYELPDGRVVDRAGLAEAAAIAFRPVEMDESDSDAESGPIDDDSEYAAELREASDRFIRAALYRAKIEAELKRAKKSEKLALEELSDLTKGSAANGDDTDSDGNGNDSESPSATETQSALFGDDQTQLTSGDSNAWRSTPLSSLDLPSTLVKKMAEQSLNTIGDLTAFCEEVGSNGFSDPLREIKGVGEAKAELIQAALDKFWDGQRKKELAAAAANTTAMTTETTEPEAPVEQGIAP